MSVAIETDYRPAILKWGVLLVFLNIADVFTTHALFARGGVELNPIAELFIYSLWVALAVKTLFPMAVIYRAGRTATKLLRNGIVVVVGIYALVLANNLFHLAQY